MKLDQGKNLEVRKRCNDCSKKKGITGTYRSTGGGENLVIDILEGYISYGLEKQKEKKHKSKEE